MFIWPFFTKFLLQPSQKLASKYTFYENHEFFHFLTAPNDKHLWFSAKKGLSKLMQGSIKHADLWPTYIICKKNDFWIFWFSPDFASLWLKKWPNWKKWIFRNFEGQNVKMEKKSQIPASTRLVCYRNL